MKICIMSVVWTALFAVAVPLLEAQTPAETQEPAAEAPEVAEVSQVPLFENLGEYHYPITTHSERAQRYFNQGLRLTYGFNHSEAIRAAS